LKYYQFVGTVISVNTTYPDAGNPDRQLSGSAWLFW